MGRSGGGSYKDYPSVPSWVVESLPSYVLEFVKNGVAAIIKHEKLGWCLCYFYPSGRTRCYKIFRKSESLLFRIVEIVESFGCVTISDLAAALGVPYMYAKRYLQYYTDAGILMKNGMCYAVDTSHPQYVAIKKEILRRGDIRQILNSLKVQRAKSGSITSIYTTTTRPSTPSEVSSEELPHLNSLMKEYTTPPFFEGTNSDRLVQIGTEQTGSKVRQSSKRIRRMEDVLKIVRERLGRDLDDYERRVVEVFYRIAAESSSVYVKVPRFGDVYQALREALGLEDMNIRDFVDVFNELQIKRVIWCSEYGRYLKCRLHRDILEER